MDNVPMHTYIHMYKCVCVYVCVHSKQGHWCMGGHSKHLRRRILLWHPHTHDWIRLPARTRMHVCVYIDNSAAGELSKSDQRLYIHTSMCMCSPHAYTHKHTHTNTYICVCVCAISFTLCAVLALFFVFCICTKNSRHIYMSSGNVQSENTFIYLYNWRFFSSKRNTRTHTPTRRHMMHWLWPGTDDEGRRRGRDWEGECVQWPTFIVI